VGLVAGTVTERHTAKIVPGLAMAPLSTAVTIPSSFMAAVIGGIIGGRPGRPPKITFGEMRSTGVRGRLICGADFHCSHSIAISADQRPDHVRLSDLEPRFVCKARGKKGVRRDFHWDKPPTPAMGYR
jgi:hypothetical protein